ncbi:hypothetical protein ERC79_17895 [Rhodococcus sp. ABRD24]|uniref:hypothetical protein n=1 Tax=Rhodococcus sp. ABRD24 TaxID=2507582 RepID=UPI00103C448D|nr:hypothetical protein [Rhodococcus sp. ABRD24]QBJ97602.1 hypothetical protein ERC79_17895 [Rhodococcus sp. ABRD24]
MTKSRISHTTRRRAAVAVASIAAAGALAVPGVAWAQNAIPAGSPSVVAPAAAAAAGTPATAVTPATETAPAVVDPGCSVTATRLSDEEIHKQIADGALGGPMVIEPGDVTLGESVSRNYVAENETGDAARTIAARNC